MGQPPPRAVSELLRTLPTASAVLDRDLRIVLVNRRWLSDFGLEGELEGRPVGELLPGLREQLELLVRPCMDGQTSSRKAIPWQRPDGRLEHLDVTMAPAHEDGGSLAAVVVHAEIVTERERLRHQLEEGQEFVQALFEGSPMGMNLCRMDGLWIESNPAFLSIIGYSRDEANGGLTYWQLTPEEYSSGEHEQLASLKETGRYGPYEKEFIRKDGSRVPVRLHGFLIERDGQQYIWSLIEDLTEHRRLEKTIEEQRLQAMQAAKLASLGEIAAGIAHEINNPLQIIDSFAFGALRALQGAPDKAREHLEAIRAASDRAARIVRSLLRFARESDAEREPVAARQLAAESLTYTAERMRVHGVTLEDSLGSDARVVCNPLEMTQVLVNLLNNAFDAVKGDGGKVSFELYEQGDRLIFDVIDDGPGVPAELEGRLFEPFATSKQHGTGLGLSISQGIVESYGGRLSYHRKQERSHFVVELPPAEAG